MHKPAKPLTVEELLTLAGLLKQWRDHLDYTMVMLEGRRWKRKSLLDIYGNLGGVVRDFHLVGAMRVSTLGALNMAYETRGMEGKDEPGHGKPAGKEGGRGKGR